MMKNKISNLFTITAILFFSLQWFLITQKPLWLGLAIVLFSIFSVKWFIGDWTFTLLPAVWLMSGLSVVYFFPNQVIAFVMILGYLAILLLAVSENYHWWQVASILNIYFFSSLIWFLTLSQALDFIWGVILLSLVSGICFLQSLLSMRRAGGLPKVRDKSLILVIAVGVLVGFAEIAWVLSFLPFGYFILGAVFTIIWAVSLNIISFSYKAISDEKSAFERFIIKNVAAAFIFVLILIIISPWLPQK